MRKFKADGANIKQLRRNRERCATQKEFAHEIGVSERRLRSIENQNAEVPLDILERMAKALRAPARSIALVKDGPHLKSSGPTGNGAAMTIPFFSSEDEVIPRFDTSLASTIRSETALLELATRSDAVVSHILTNLTTETDAYAEELLTLLESVTRDKRDWLAPINGREELHLRKRMRELLVLLKGNDVWVYVTDHYKFLPESYQVRPEDAPQQIQSQAIIAFGAPGEYGETTLKVPIDHGQPWVCKFTLPFLASDKRIEGGVRRDRSAR